MSTRGVTYTVEVAWSDATIGVFTVGTSLVGGPDVVGGFYAGRVFDPITSDVQHITAYRGRDTDLAGLTAGACTIRLHDHTGKYAATNPSSPLAGLLRPMRPVRVAATVDGERYGIFYGFVRRIESRPEYGTQEATIEATDLTVWLERARPVIAATGPTRTGTAIGLVLDAIGWTDPTMRALDLGDVIPGFSADGSDSGLALIAALLEVERGRFWVDGTGRARFVGRWAANRAPYTSAQSTLPGSMTAVAPGVDLDSIRNRARVTRAGGVTQTHTDEDSRRDYGYSDYQPLTSPYLRSDAQALSLARWLVAKAKAPTPGVRYLDLDGAEPGARAALLAREVGDRVAVTDRATRTARDFHIERLEHRIDVRTATHRGSWRLSDRGPAEPQVFVVAQSTVGGPDIVDITGV